MKTIDNSTLDLLWFDADAREMPLRQLVTERMAENPPPAIDDHIVATYFLALRTTQLRQAAKEIAYHATSGIKNPPPGSLLGPMHGTRGRRGRLGRRPGGSACCTWPFR